MLAETDILGTYRDPLVLRTGRKCDHVPSRVSYVDAQFERTTIVIAADIPETWDLIVVEPRGGGG